MNLGAFTHRRRGALLLLFVPLLSGNGRGQEQSQPSVAPVVTAPMRAELFEQANRTRAAGGSCRRRGVFGPAGPLQRLAELDRAAQMQATQIARLGYFSHIDPHGGDPSSRARSQGFTGTCTENLAWGQHEPEQAVAAWLDSPDHCQALLDPTHHWTGVGYDTRIDGSPVWVQLFARDRGSGCHATLTHRCKPGSVECVRGRL